MAELSRDGDRLALRVAHVVGRSPKSDLVLDEEHVSSRHARLRWEGESWTVTDLDSRNGTWVDGERLAAGKPRRLRAGSRIAFGHAEDAWALESLEPPLIGAFPLDGGEPVRALSGLLALPREEAPEIVVLQQVDGRWRAEPSEGAPRPVHDRDHVVAGGREWALHLPEPDPGATLPPMGALRLGECTLRLRVGEGEREVSLALTHGGEIRELDTGPHHRLLLHLARLREEDRANGIAEAERGWIARDRLLQLLDVEEAALRADVQRIRRALAEAGVGNTGDLFDLKSSSRTMRLGRVEVLLEERPAG